MASTTDYLGGFGSGAGSGALVGAGIGSIIPGVGTGIGAAVGGGLGGLLGLYGAHATGERKETLQDASRMSREMAEEQRRFQLEGIDRALARYGPARAGIQALYGDPKQWRL